MLHDGPDLSSMHDQQLLRPRIARAVANAAQREFVLLSGPPAIGRTVAVRQWVRSSGSEWLTFRESVAPNEVMRQVRRSAAPVAVSLRISEGDPVLLQNTLGQLAATPSPHRPVVFVHGTLECGRDRALMHRVLGPDGFTSVSPATFGLTAAEVGQLARLRGVALASEQLVDLWDATSGHFGLADMALVHIGQAGARDLNAREVVRDAVVELLYRTDLSLVIPPDMWKVLALLGLSDRVPGDVAAQVAREDGAPTALSDLIFSGLVRVHGSAVRPVVALRPAISLALAAQSSQELLAGSIMVARHVWAAGRLEDALSLVRAAGDAEGVQQFLGLVEETLDRVPAGQLTSLVTAAEAASLPGVAAAYARALVDITAPGHSGRVPESAQRRAAALIATADVDGLQRAKPRALAELTRAVVARLGGDDAAAAVSLARARALSGQVGDARLRASVILQECAFRLSRGEYGPTALALRELVDLEGGGAAADFARLALNFVGRSVDVPSPIDASRATATPVVSAEVAERDGLTYLVHVLNSYGSAYVSLTRLRVDDAAESLRVGFGPPGAEPDLDPKIFSVLRMHLESVIGLVTSNVPSALHVLEMFEATSSMQRGPGFQQSLMAAVRAELLSAAGHFDEARATLARVASEHVLGQRVSARVLWESGDVAAAAGMLNATVADPGLYTGRHGVWALVLHSHVMSELGDHRRADDSLARALVLGSRGRVMVPFARHGRSRFIGMVRRARTLELDYATRGFLDELEIALGDLMAPVIESRLSVREQVVLDAMADAQDIRSVADRLTVSTNTVKTQLRSIYTGLGIAGWEDAAFLARSLRAARGAVR